MRVLVALLAALALAPVADAASVTVHAGTSSDGTLYFQPKTVRVAKGEQVTLTVINDDTDKPHDWALLSYDGRDIEAYTGPGESKTIRFDASEAGSYRVVCQVVGHKQAGMQGAFVVESKGVPDAGAPLTLLGIGAVALALSARRARGAATRT